MNEFKEKFKEKAGFIKSLKKYALQYLKECIYVVSKHTPYINHFQENLKPTHGKI